MKNIEIEIRIALDDNTIFENWLINNAKYINQSYQHDIYYEPIKEPFIHLNNRNEKDADEWLRVRNSKGITELCYKKWHRDQITKESLYADEIEVRIDNYEKLILLLNHLNYHKISEIKKTRDSWSYRQFKIEKDTIEGLGVFFEIEFIDTIFSPALGKDLIFSFLKEINIDNWKLIDRGYPWMQWNSCYK
jgi:predicted adenylyl cyclase CyaB